ncbi:MAG TPA: hypothetical protein VH701_10335 [Vicinamibacterales bacterium]|jgi:hypothetical protein
MSPRLIRSSLFALSIAGVYWSSPPLAAQWLKYPTAGVPRNSDGRVNMNAPTPRTPDGKPDFSGMWLTDDGFPCPNQNPDQLTCGPELPISRFGINIGLGLQGGLPYKPETAALVKKRTAENSKDDPHARCLPDTFLRSYGLPHIQKFIQVPGLLVMLDEVNAAYRQVFTDGRPFPDDPNPTWNGYSSAKWEGDTLVIDSIGFLDDLWIDISGNFISSEAKVRERIRRPDYGHLQIEVTVDSEG